MRPDLIIGIAICVLVRGGIAQAQTPVQIQIGPSTPSLEFGTHIDFMELWGDARRTLGGRFARRHADWLLSEFAYDRTSWKYEDRESRLLMAGIRIQDPVTRTGKRAFVSVGVAKAGGMTFGWSPVLASGVQQESPGGIVAFRVELQLFLRGSAQPPRYDRARVLMGLAVGIP